MQLHLLSLLACLPLAASFSSCSRAPWTPARPGRAIRAGWARSLAHPPGGEGPDAGDDEGDAVDLETLTREELVDLMDELGGPPIDAALSLEDARAAVVGFLQTGETVDIEDLSVDGLRELMVELGGPVIAEDAPLAAARDTAWEFVQTLQEEEHDGDK